MTSGWKAAHTWQEATWIDLSVIKATRISATLMVVLHLCLSQATSTSAICQDSLCIPQHLIPMAMAQRKRWSISNACSSNNNNHRNHLHPLRHNSSTRSMSIHSSSSSNSRHLVNSSIPHLSIHLILMVVSTITLISLDSMDLSLWMGLLSMVHLGQAPAKHLLPHQG